MTSARHPPTYECMDTMHVADATQQFIEQMSAGIAIFDGEMRYRAVSRRYLSDLAWLFSTEVLPSDKVIGRTFREVSPDMPTRWGDAHERVLAGAELGQEEDFVARPDGRAVWVRWSLKPWRDVHGRIAGALWVNEIITQQVETSRALADSEARFRVTFMNAPVGIAHLSPDLRWLRVNDAFCHIHGYRADELTTKSLRDVVPPDDFAKVAALADQVRNGMLDRFQIDRRALQKEGTIIWVRVTASCLRKSDGSIDYLVVVLEDISARKRAEEQVHLLMREAKHRVKNLLGLVQVIARQTAAGNPEDFVTGNSEDFIRRFTEHTQALAANQDLLGRDQHQGADLEDLVRTHLSHFADVVGLRVAVVGPKLRLNAAAAQAIGLALHELATNAGKYGALSTDAGRVDVGWQLDNDTFTMSWTERSGPPVRPPERRGFGSTVIETMAKQTVGGEVQLNYASSGLEWRLTCPAANAIDPEYLKTYIDGKSA